MLAPSPGQDKATRVNNLIAQFERDLAAGRFPPGGFMGTRQELCATYGVTSPIFFQASRVLVHRGLAELRPGNRGGLFASDHSIDQVGKRLATYLECIGVEFIDARRMILLLHELCVRGATGRLTVETAAAVRRTVTEVRACDAFDRGRLLSGMFQQFVDASGNVVLALLFRITSEVMLDYSSEFFATADEDVPLAAYVDLLSRLVEAVIAADHEQSGVAYQQFRDAMLRRQTMPAPRLKGDLPSFAHRCSDLRNLPERLAAHMLREFRLSGWPVGEKLGNEPDLMARYGVSRATFRQALRLLEEYSAVETRRGPKGGVLIAAPNAVHVSQTALALLIGRGADLEMSRTLLVSLMTLGLDLVFARGEAARAAVIEACERSGDNRQVIGAVSSAILQQARLKTLALFVRLLAALERMLSDEDLADVTRLRVVSRALAAATAGDDRAGARGALAELTRRFGVGSPSLLN